MALQVLTMLLQERNWRVEKVIVTQRSEGQAGKASHQSLLCWQDLFIHLNGKGNFYKYCKVALYSSGQD